MIQTQERLEDIVAEIRNEQTRIRCILHILRKKQLRAAIQQCLENQIIIYAIPETSTKA